MRYIKKGAEPHIFKEWKRNNKDSPENLCYKNCPEKNAIKESLLEEQGYLCAYTLQRLNGVDDCHIEHIRPQNTTPEHALDYGNMVACFPNNGGDTSLRYGAPIKGGTPIVLGENFISPHHPSCEEYFHYDNQGKVQAVPADYAAAISTIGMLQLNHGNLAELRQSAIEAHGIAISRRRVTRNNIKYKSAAEARRFAEDVLKPSQKKLEPFCIALAQIALEYAKKEEKRVQYLRAIRD